MVLQITPVERAVLQWLAEGTDHNEIASRLETIEKGIDVDLAALFTRLGVRTPADAISAGIKRGLVTAPEQLA
jgi:DNA-binding NarL/FixJ family response regulator